MRQRVTADIGHRQEHSSHATGSIGERKEIGEMHAADHAEMFARLVAWLCHMKSLAQAWQRKRRLFLSGFCTTDALTWCHPRSAAGYRHSMAHAFGQEGLITRDYECRR